MNEKSLRHRRLAVLLKSKTGLISVEDAVKALGLEKAHAAKLLAGWHNQGVLRRVSQGLYVPIPPSAIDQIQVLEDPWVLVPEIYDPGYVGGWTALEHWELTEQLFRSVCVLSNKRTTYGEATHQGVSFFIRHVPRKMLFGTKSVWRNQIKIQISDPHKTILDIVDDVYLGAGLQHTVDCLLQFKKTYSSQRDLELLLEYALRINNGALYKKLGYLTESLEFSEGFVSECRSRMTKGYAYLDKQSKDNQLITKWNLWVPKGSARDRQG